MLSLLLFSILTLPAPAATHTVVEPAASAPSVALLDCVLTDDEGGTVCVTISQGLGNTLVQVGPCGGNSSSTSVPSGGSRRVASDCFDLQYWLVKPKGGATWGNATCDDLDAKVFPCKD